MKKMDEIIADLVDFAEENGLIGDGSIYISVGDLQVSKTIPVDLDNYDNYDEDDYDDYVPTVDRVFEEASEEDIKRNKELAELRFRCKKM